MKHSSDQLQQREEELRLVSLERTANLKILETHKVQLRELESKLKDFSKYETIISSKFESLEELMSDMHLTKTKYIQNETKLKKGNNRAVRNINYFYLDLEDSELRIKENLKLIQDLRVEREKLETLKESLENDNKDRCTEFNGKIYELNAEIKDKSRKIELLTGEKELLLSDLKIMTKDRDRILKECSIALKEITELAVSDLFMECESKDLGNLECSVSWIKSKCLELNNAKTSQNLELVNLRQTIQEFEKQIQSNSDEFKNRLIEIEKLKVDVDSKSQDVKEMQILIEEYKIELESVKEFKRKVKNMGISDEFDKIIETLSQKKSDKKLENLNNEVKMRFLIQISLFILFR